VRVNPLSRNKLHLAILIEVGKMQRMDLGKTAVDQFFGPNRFAVNFGLLEPIQTKIVTHPPNNIGICVAVEVMTDDFDACCS
jgi:hypothetical protein